MGKKYHISQETGEVNICRADKHPCPIGGTHYESEEEARAGYEKEQAEKGNSISTLKKGAKDSIPSNAEAIKDLQKELKEVQERIKENQAQAENESDTSEQTKSLEEFSNLIRRERDIKDEIEARVEEDKTEANKHIDNIKKSDELRENLTKLRKENVMLKDEADRLEDEIAWTQSSLDNIDNHIKKLKAQGQTPDEGNEIEYLEEKLERMNTDLDQKARKISKNWAKASEIEKELKPLEDQGYTEIENLRERYRANSKLIESHREELNAAKDSLNPQHREQPAIAIRKLMKENKEITERETRLATEKSYNEYKEKYKDKGPRSIQKIDSLLRESNDFIKDYKNRLETMKNAKDEAVKNYDTLTVSKKRAANNLLENYDANESLYKRNLEAYALMNEKLEDERKYSEIKDQYIMQGPERIAESGLSRPRVIEELERKRQEYMMDVDQMQEIQMDAHTELKNAEYDSETGVYDVNEGVVLDYIETAKENEERFKKYANAYQQKIDSMNKEDEIVMRGEKLKAKDRERARQAKENPPPKVPISQRTLAKAVSKAKAGDKTTLMVGAQHGDEGTLRALASNPNLSKDHIQTALKRVKNDRTRNMLETHPNNK